MATIPLPTGSYVTADTRASAKRLVNCFSEIAPQTSDADLKSKVPPIYLRRMFGISPYAQVNTPNPSLLLHMDGTGIPIDASLLLHFDGTNGQTAITDSSVFANAVTHTASAALSTTDPQFGTASGNFTGTGGWSVPESGGGILDLHQTASTVEFWLRVPTMASLTAGTYIIWSDWNFVAQDFIRMYINVTSTGVGSVTFQANFTAGPGTFSCIGPASFPTDGAWHHIALVTSSAHCQIFQDGTGGTVQTFAFATNASLEPTFFIGFQTPTNVANYIGLMDELRIIKGANVYTIGVNFTPPTSPLSPIFILPPAPVFTDSSLNNFTMTETNAAISTLDPKFGTGDGSFPSTTFGSTVTTPITAAGPLDLFGPVGGGDFTIQGWFMVATFTGNPLVIFDYGDTSGGSDNGIILEVNSASVITVTPTVAGWSAFTNNLPGSGFTAGSWYSFALVRKGANATLYISGVALPNTATNWTSSAVAPALVTIGASPTVTGASQPFFLDEVVVYKSALYTVNYTPALSATADPVPNAVPPPVRGMWDMQGITYVVIGPSLYTLTPVAGQTAGILTLLGTGIAGNSFVRMTDNTACLVIVVPGTLVAYTYTVTTGLQQLLAGPITSMGAIDCWFVDSFIVFLALNGREFYNDDGQTASGQGQITFNTGGVFPREFGTDPFVGMCVDHRTVLMFGTRTSEAYVDTGNTTESPFSSAPDGFMQIGAHPQAGYTVALQDQSVFWVANDLTVRRRNGQTPVRVSNSGIEAVLEENKENLLGCFAMTCTIGGHPLWVLNIPLASRTLVYDCLTTEWFELESLIDQLGYWRPLCSYNAQGLQLVGDSQSTQIGYLDASTFTEFTQPMRARLSTQSIYDKHNRITTNRVELVVTCGEGASLTSGAKATLLKSKDSGATYTARQTQSLGALGQRQARVFWTKLGQQRDLALAFQISDPTPTFTVDIQADVVGGKW